MDKIRRFLGVLASLFIVLFSANVFAAGYSCDSSKKYTSCNAGYYLNGTGVGNSCTKCPDAYPNSDANNSEGITACYSNTKSRAWTGSPVNGTTPTGCSAVTEWNTCTVAACEYVAYANSTGDGDGKIKSGCATNNNSCTKTAKTVTASAGYFVNGNTCSLCPAAYPNSANGNTGGRTQCYSNERDRAWTGLQVNGTTPANCSAVTEWNSCSVAACKYTVYSNAAGNGDGNHRSGCETNAGTCTKTVKSVSAKSGFFANATTCSACPASYPNSANGNTGGRTQCYSNTRSRAWSGTQLPCSRPTNCSNATCAACSKSSCEYVMYSNAAGTGDGALKSGCSSNNASCQQTVASVEAKENYYVSGKTCPACSSLSSGQYTLSAGGNIGSDGCYYIETAEGTATNGKTPTGCSRVLQWQNCLAESCQYNVYYGKIAVPCKPLNCTKTPATVLADSGNYVSGVTCPVCDTNFPKSPLNNSYTADQCYRNCIASDVTGASAVSGTITKGGTSTCKATTCATGYCITSDGECITKPVNGTCAPAGSENPIQCNEGYTLNDDGTDCVAQKFRVQYFCSNIVNPTWPVDYVAYNSTYTTRLPSFCSTKTGYEFDGWEVYSGDSTEPDTVLTAGESVTWKYLSAVELVAKFVPTACPKGKYLENSTCKTCPVGYTSDLNATSINDCYTRSETDCIDPGYGNSCPANSYDSCYYFVGEQVPCKQYYGSSGTCDPIEETASCLLDPMSVNCHMNYYNDQTGVCKKCVDIPGSNGTWSESIGGSNEDKNICYQSCLFDCETYVTENLTPQHATCKPLSQTINGGKYYPYDVCEPLKGSSCTATACACEAGYKFVMPTGEEGDIGKCDPEIYQITLNNGYDDNTSDTIYQKYTVGWYSNSDATDTLSKAPTMERQDYYFRGYYTAITGGEMVIDENGTLPDPDAFTADTDLYAHWEAALFTCTSGSKYDGTPCPSGHYCPGGSVTAGDESAANGGCQPICPTDSAGGEISTDTGASAQTQCRTTRTNKAVSSIHGRVTEVCYYNAGKSNYSDNCTVQITACDAGYYLNASKNECIPTDAGEYSPADDLNKYSCADLNGAHDNATTDNTASGAATLCYNQCQSQTIDHGTLVPKNTKEFFNGTKIPECSYTAQCDPEYKANASQTRCVWADPSACPEGFYCPDGSDEPIECPTDKAGNIASSEIGAKTIESCFIKYDPYDAFQKGTGSAICYYSTGAKDYVKCQNITAKTCDQGYYYRDAGSAFCTEIVSGNYSPDGDIQQTPCPLGGSGSNQFAANWDACYKNCETTIPHSATIAAKEEKVFGISASAYSACQFNVTCVSGYTVSNNNTENPTCQPNKYIVTLDKNGGEGDITANIECTFDSGSCTLPSTANLRRAGYSVGSVWCTEKNGGGKCFNAASTVTDNISATGMDQTLYPVWTPNVYKVTLKHSDATQVGTPDIVYLKYATGWYADETATLPLAQMTQMPAKVGYEFAGYASAGKVPVVASNGTFLTTEAALTFTTSNADVNVVWSAGNTKCNAGEYYPGTGSSCLPCKDNHYCQGGSYPTDAGEAGINACRNGGKTTVGTPALSEAECYKENLNTYVSEHGAGTQTCYFDPETLEYSATCRDKFITSCHAGYWQANKAPVQSAPDCVPVENGYYSAESETERTKCPAGGTTTETTAASIQSCLKNGVDYSAEFGTGTQRCFYSSGDGESAIYNRDCDMKTITKCRGGYWLDAEITSTDCSPVGYNNYSETNDIEKHACEGGGKTNNEITSSPLACYKDSEEYTAAHGGGYRTCYYTSGTGENALYETGCETPTLTYCAGGYYANIQISTEDCIAVGYGFYSPAPTPSHMAESLDRTACPEGHTTNTTTSDSASACFICPAGKICIPGSGNEPQTCAKATNGTHPNSDPGNTDVNGCWRDCATITNAATMKGHDYYGKTDTCEIDRCKAGYSYNASAKSCDICPAGTFCGGDDKDCPAGQNCSTPKSCADLGDGSWKYSDVGATGPESCYQMCESYPLIGGTAIPVSERAHYASMCAYKGIDEEGNPCEIQDGACTTTSCKPSFEMINNRCVPCNREHAMSYKSTGNCMVDICEPGWHPYGQKCEPDIAECSATHALRAESQWDYKKNSYSVCTIKECEDGFHIESNACVADTHECTIEHGIGEKKWDHSRNAWGNCEATFCDPGYTNDPYESNDPTKPCGDCRNKFGKNGELAASSYSRGCTITACMYQGEGYNLDNNECVPICDTRNDDTGSRHWDPNSHKCIRTCNPGYISW